MSSTVNKLSLARVSDLEFVMTRTFDAPRSLVFEALSKPEHVVKWWGCRDMTMPVCEIDFRVGGAYRYVGRTADGNECPMKGEYLEIDPPARIRFTEVFDVEPYNNYPATVTVTLEEADGKTNMTVTVLHMTKEACAGHLGSGVERGAGESYDRLEELLIEMRQEQA